MDINEYKKDVRENYQSDSDIFWRKAVSWSTFRAYSERSGCYKKPNRPSLVYRERLNSFLACIKDGNIESSFKKFHFKWHASLEKYRKEKSWGELQPYQINKLLDLSIKPLCARPEISQKRQKWFENNMNVPLDKYTLLYLKKMSLKYNDLIGKYPSMWDIDKGRLKYGEIQKEIKLICQKEYISPLKFELDWQKH